MKSLAINNDYQFAFALVKNAPNRQRVPATGLTGLTVYFSAQDAGTASYAGTTVNLSELSEVPGTYVGTLLGADAASGLAGVSTAFRVLYLAPGSILASDEYRIDGVRRLDT